MDVKTLSTLAGATQMAAAVTRGPCSSGSAIGLAGLNPCYASSNSVTLGTEPHLSEPHVLHLQNGNAYSRVIAKATKPSSLTHLELDSTSDSYCHTGVSIALRRKQEAGINPQYVCKNCVNIPGSSLQSDFSPSPPPFVQPKKRHSLVPGRDPQSSSFPRTVRMSTAFTFYSPPHC